MKKKKPRVVWLVGKPTPLDTHLIGLVPDLWLPGESLAEMYGKPVKFVEAK